MAPIAPVPERRPLLSRKLALLCALGAGCGAIAGAIALSVVLREPPAEAEDVGLGAMPAPSAVAIPDDDAQRVMKTMAAEAPAHLDRAIERSEREMAPTVSADEAAAQAPAPAADTPGEQAATSAGTTAPEAEAEEAADDGRSKRAEGQRARRGARRNAATPTVEKPSRGQVLAAMSRVQGRVEACFGGTHGVVTADLTVLGRTGRVTTAHVSGQSGPVGSCVARAVRKAKFPKFAAESITIRYPMKY